MEIHGYKAFNGDMTNRYGFKFKVGETYEIGGPISAGNRGNGIHFCKNLEDTLRFFDDDRIITEVTSLGKVAEGEDEQGYYDNYYAAKKLRIDKILTRKEILEYILKINNEFRVINFLMYFKLTDEEIDYFIARYDKSIKILKAILYYQKGMKDIYNTEGLDRSLLTGKKM